MREIRFRAWDLVDKRMIMLNEIANDAWGIIVMYDILKGKDKRYIPMEYADLFDVKGNQIYEGDICSGLHRHQNGENEYIIKDQVYFSVGGFTLFNKPLQDFTWYYEGIEHKQKILKHIMWMTPAREVIPAYYYIIENIEVIGNIYENPDLLT